VRAEAGLPTEAREPVALDALMAGLVEGARARHELMTLSLDAAPLTVRAVPARLETALRNVLDNATAFAGPEDPEAWVGVTVYEDEGAAVIRVSDSGPGIAEADLPRIFERFFTTRVGSGGTGLGLALTATVVEAHGGSVEAASPPGGGAVITLRLPLAPARAGEEPP
jgi:signal transduction histidine kinase